MTSRAIERKLLDVLERWRDERVAVRVVTRADELVAVFIGTLQARVDEKHPALFWPVELGQGAPGGLERPGIYVHRQLLTEVRVHVGEFVVEYVQAGVTVNVRRLTLNRGDDDASPGRRDEGSTGGGRGGKRGRLGAQLR